MTLREGRRAQSLHMCRGRCGKDGTRRRHTARRIDSSSTRRLRSQWRSEGTHAWAHACKHTAWEADETLWPVRQCKWTLTRAAAVMASTAIRTMARVSRRAEMTAQSCSSSRRRRGRLVWPVSHGRGGGEWEMDTTLHRACRYLHGPLASWSCIHSGGSLRPVQSASRVRPSRSPPPHPATSLSCSASPPWSCCNASPRCGSGRRTAARATRSRSSCRACRVRRSTSTLA